MAQYIATICAVSSGSPSHSPSALKIRLSSFLLSACIVLYIFSFFLFFSLFMKLHLKCCIQHWGLWYKKDVKLLEWIKRMPWRWSAGWRTSPIMTGRVEIWGCSVSPENQSLWGNSVLFSGESSPPRKPDRGKQWDIFGTQGEVIHFYLISVTLPVPFPPTPTFSCSFSFPFPFIFFSPFFSFFPFPFPFLHHSYY